MSVGPILTLGLGAFTGGGVHYLPTLGYGTGATPPPPTPTVVVTTPGGVRKSRGKKPPVLRFSEVVDREDIGTFLKSQLKLRHPDSAFVDPVQSQDLEKERKLLARQQRREKEMRVKAQEAEARFAVERAQNEEKIKKDLSIEDSNLRILLMLASIE